jgi:threonine-phosphate decarboxylase
MKISKRSGRVVIPPAIHGGNVHAASRANGRPIPQLIDFSASINPLGVSPLVQRALVNAIPFSVHYPDPYGDDLRKQIGQSFRVDPESIVLGNGSVELISILPRALSIRHGLVIGPTFMEFERALTLGGAQSTYLHARAADRYAPPVEQVQAMLKKRKYVGRSGTYGRPSPGPPIDAVFLCNPNSPTGRAVTRSGIRQLLQTVQQVKAHLIVDEAFVDFCPSCSVLNDVAKSQKLIVIRSFTKFFAIPGLRIGYVVGPRDIVTRIRGLQPPWSVNSLAQAAAMAALQDSGYRGRSLALIRRERVRFMSRLRSLPGVRLFPSQANFLLLELPPKYSVPRIAEWCREQGVLVRDCQDFSGMNRRSLRLAVRRSKENDLLVNLLTRALTVCE